MLRLTAYEAFSSMRELIAPVAEKFADVRPRCGEAVPGPAAERTRDGALRP
jgi:hypothetical protein